MDIIKAKFKGQPFLGFETGQVYTLRTEIKYDWIWFADKYGPGYHKYRGVKTFFTNWEMQPGNTDMSRK